MLIVFSMFVEQKNKHKILVGMKVKWDIYLVNWLYSFYSTNDILVLAVSI